MNINEIEQEDHSNGTYASLIPSLASKYKISLLIKNLGIEDGISENDMHCTVIYSRAACPNLSESDLKVPCEATAKEFAIFGHDPSEKCLVLKLNCPEAEAMHKMIRKEHGGTHDYDSYDPHITLTYNWQGEKVPSAEFLENFAIEFDDVKVDHLS